MFEAKNAFVGALLVLRKFTIFNIKFYTESEESDYSFAVLLMPLLGLVIGLCTLIFSSLKFIYSPIFSGALLLTYYCIITKSNNIKDTYKIISIIIKSNEENKQFYNIISLVVLCTLYFALFSVSSIRALILMPMVGFCSLIIQALIIKRDKSSSSILKYSSKNHSYFAFIFSFLFTIIINYKLSISLSLTYIIVSFIVNYFESKLKILPSTVEGFIIEISQILFLVISYILMI